MSARVRPDAVPGWVLDHVVGEADGAVLVAARPDHAVGAGEAATYRVLRIPVPSGHDDEIADDEVRAAPAPRPTTEAGVAPPGRRAGRVGARPLVVCAAVVLAVASLTHLRASAAAGERRVAWDGASAMLTLHDGAAAPRRFAVGTPGDQVVVGDWRGDGHPTAVLYRPATGELWRFARWPDPADATGVETLVARPWRTARRGATLRAGRVLGHDVAWVGA